MGALDDKVFLNDVNEISIPMGASYRQTPHNSYLPQYASIENGFDSKMDESGYTLSNNVSHSR